jgi:hypothetical protein
VNVIGDAGDAIAKLTEGFKHLAITGIAGYDYIAARRERARLINISRHVST